MSLEKNYRSKTLIKYSRLHRLSRIARIVAAVFAKTEFALTAYGLIPLYFAALVLLADFSQLQDFLMAVPSLRETTSSSSAPFGPF